MKIVEAVKTPAEVKRVAEILQTSKGAIYSDIWVLGVNAALRISDLLELTMEHALTGVIEINEGKTGKSRKIPLNPTAMNVVNARATANPEHKWLFQVDSNRAKGQPISRVSVARAFKEVGERESLQLKLGTHSMRKTLGWVMHSAGAPIERICKVLNHSSPAVTMHYIGLTQHDIDSAYTEFEIKI